MSKAIKHCATALRAGGTVALLAICLTGCAGTPREVMLEAPIIERDPVVTREPTLLEEFQNLKCKHEGACLRNSQLAADVSDLTKRNEKLAETLKAAEANIAGLQEKNHQLEDVSAKYDAARTELLELGKTLRGVRHELLVERLARVKLEQELVAVKLRNARDRRRELIKDATAESEGDAAEKEDEENG